MVQTLMRAWQVRIVAEPGDQAKALLLLHLWYKSRYPERCREIWERVSCGHAQGVEQIQVEVPPVCSESTLESLESMEAGR